jgi:hypothetical protein
MSSLILAFAYLRRRWGQALLSVLVGALGVSAVAIAYVGVDSLPEAAERAWGGEEDPLRTPGAPRGLRRRGSSRP